MEMHSKMPIPEVSGLGRRLVHGQPQYLAIDGEPAADPYDIALLHLSTPATQTPVHIAGAGETALWATGQQETIAGFGTTDPDTTDVFTDCDPKL